MTNNTENGQEHAGYTAIKPAEIILTHQGLQESRVSGPAPASGNIRWLWPALFVLGVIAVAVVFVLPHYVTPPELTAKNETTVAVPGSNTAAAHNNVTSKPSEPAPWQTAQLARQRSKSQELLSRMLELQEQLEQKNVHAWAAPEYERILKMAIDGDAAYQQQDFQASSTLYSDAADAMSALLDNMETRFAETITQGNTELDNGEAVNARQAFELALLMKPDAEPALTGLQRAGTLDQVLKLITEGNDLQQNDKLDEAKDRYEQALALDKHAAIAKQQLSVVTGIIRDGQFNRLMSAGYAYLQNNDLAQAKSSFEQATRLKPGSGETSSALGQIQTRMLNDQISTIIQAAVALESGEKWQEAVAEYDRALVLDANLAEAQQGKQFAGNRAMLDGKLEELIAQPERLSNKAVYEDARLLYQQAVMITPAEPRLTGQLEKLHSLLSVAMIPVVILFKSDNLTDVSVLRVGTLGKFAEKNLSLLPGKYTAVGSRAGYRDVRVEFSIASDAPAQTIEISAAEKIASR